MFALTKCCILIIHLEIITLVQLTSNVLRVSTWQSAFIYLHNIFHTVLLIKYVTNKNTVNCVLQQNFPLAFKACDRCDTFNVN